MMGQTMARRVLLLHGFTHTGASWEPVIGALGKRYRAVAPDIRGHGAASERRPVDLAGLLAELPIPVVLVVGERDHKFREIASALAESIPEAELVVVPGTGHAVHLEAPGRVADIIAAGCPRG